MEVIFLLVLPAALWAQSWFWLGLYNNPRTLGIIAATVGITLIGLVVFGGSSSLLMAGDDAIRGPAISGLVIVWSIYALMVAGVALWGHDERTVGFYALFLWVVSLFYVGYYFLAGHEHGMLDGGAMGLSPIMGVVSLLLTIISAMVFFYLGPPFARMRQATGWFTLVLSIIMVLLGGLSVLGMSLS